MAAVDWGWVLDAHAQLLMPYTLSPPLKTCLGPQGQGRRALSTLRRRQAPPGMLQTELLSLVCHRDKCGLPSGHMSPSSPPPRPFRKCFPSLKGEGLTPATCVPAADRCAQAVEGGASCGSLAVTGGHLPEMFSSLPPQPYPLATPQRALLWWAQGGKCPDHAKHHPYPLPFTLTGWEGGSLPCGQTPISHSELSFLAFLRVVI